MKLESKTAVCKICFKQFSDFNMVNFLQPKNSICDDCLKSFVPLFEKTLIQKEKTLILYEYNDFLRNILFQLKGNGDIEIASAFLSSLSLFLRLKYFQYTIVLAPSFLEREQVRGFNHLSEIFKELKMPTITPLIKTSDRKQSDLNLQERKEISKYIIWDKNFNIKKKKVLLVDDVITSGSTINACLTLIKEQHPKKIQILVISKAT